jgi:SAM-dependent methyltransferase
MIRLHKGRTEIREGPRRAYDERPDPRPPEDGVLIHPSRNCSSKEVFDATRSWAARQAKQPPDHQSGEEAKSPQTGLPTTRLTGQIEYRSARSVEVNPRRRLIEVLAVPYHVDAIVDFRGRRIAESFSNTAFADKQPKRILATRDHDWGRIVGRALWLAAREWQVTAVDFAATALAHARATAEAMGPEIADRIDWVEADLETWAPRPDAYDLVACLYVHAAGSVEELVRRLATGVARGGTLLLVGHRPIDPATGGATAAAGQVQVSVEAAFAALDPDQWELLVAEDRPRPVAGSGVDAVIRARRRLDARLDRLQE